MKWIFYPKEISKEEVFIKATVEHQVKADWGLIPDSEYNLSQTIRGFGKVSATMRVEDGSFIVLQRCTCAPTKEGRVTEVRLNAPIENNALQDAVSTNSPNAAVWIVLGHSNNGWTKWKDKAGKSIDTYRK